MLVPGRPKSKPRSVDDLAKDLRGGGTGGTGAAGRQGRLVPEGGEPIAESPTPRAAPAGNVPVHYVNKLRFNVNYKLENAGKSGVKTVSLYWRHPDSPEWSLYGENKTKDSPFPVNVDGEGRYGIYLRATSGVGLSEPAPANGSAPQMWVVVDLSPPSVRLEPPRVKYGEVSEAFFAWKVSDEHPAKSKVRLSYSAVDGSDAGKWKEFQRDLANDGTCRWRIPSDAPFRFHVRLDAEDAAGNAAHDETVDPVIVDNARPRVVTLGAEPGKDAESPPERTTERQPDRNPAERLSEDSSSRAAGRAADREDDPPALAPAAKAPKPVPTSLGSGSDLDKLLEPGPAAKPSVKKSNDAPPPPAGKSAATEKKLEGLLPPP
jgi:hypothetical protein